MYYSILKGTLSRDGYFFEGLKIFNSTSCVCAVGFQGLTKAVHCPIYTIINFLFASLKLLHAHPLSRKLARPSTHKKTEKERQLADRRGGGGGVGEEPNHTTKKAWSSINHSILSGSHKLIQILINSNVL